MVSVDERAARQWALKALGRRMQTAFEIREGLLGRGYTEDVAWTVVEMLTARGYIDDLEFARAFTTSRTKNSLHGRLRILRDLKRKGIDGDLAESVLRESLTVEDEMAAAVKAAEKKWRSLKAGGARGREALYRHLRSRGFTTQVISLAMAGFSFEEDTS